MELIVFICVLIAVFTVEVIYYRLHALDNLNLKVDFSKNVADFGEDVELIEVAENRKRLPLPFIILKFECPREIRFYDMENTSTSDHLYREDMLTMRAFSKHTRRIKAQCTKRGYYVFPRVGITTSDLFLTERFTRDFANDSDLVVLPELIDSNIMRTLTSVTLSDMQCRRTLLTDPFTLAGIREYDPNDPMKSINWTASAKTGTLMVNQNASTCTQKVHVFVNLDFYNQKRSTSLLEASISLAYSYLHEIAELGIPASIYTNGRDVITDSPAISETDLGSATLEERAVMLARIDLKKPVVPFEEIIEKYLSSTDRDDFILIISPQFNGSFRPLLSEAKSRRPSVHWLMPSYKITPDANPEPDIAPSYIRWEVIGND
ncbi:MAG: DUF58 domain-containing protein [Clostridiales bacterium]|nr:DUF58 domain-containing protein [Clostridiales bacterium]